VKSSSDCLRSWGKAQGCDSDLARDLQEIITSVTCCSGRRKSLLIELPERKFRFPDLGLPSVYEYGTSFGTSIRAYFAFIRAICRNSSIRKPAQPCDSRSFERQRARLISREIRKSEIMALEPLIFLCFGGKLYPSVLLTRLRLRPTRHVWEGSAVPVW
jgi:hypothetical protein